MFRKTPALLAAALAAVLAIPAATAADAPASIQDFVRHPRFQSAKISPNGKYLEITAQVEDHVDLVILRTSDLSVVGRQELPNQQSVGPVFWVGPERLMFMPVKTFGRRAAPQGTGEWYAMNADGSDKEIVISYGQTGATDRGRQVGNEYFQMLEPRYTEAGTVLMTAYKGGSTEGAYSEVVAVDTHTGSRRALVKSPRKDCDFALDEKKEPRWANCTDTRGEGDVFEEHLETYRRGADGKWMLVNRSQDTGRRLEILGTAPDGRVYALQDDRKAPKAFGVVDKATAAFTALLSDPVADPSDYIVASDGDTIIGVVTEAGIPKVTLFDEPNADADVYAELAQSFPGKFIDFTSATSDGSRIMFAVRDDSSPTELYLYDRASKQARFLMRNQDWLDPARMATVKPFSFRTRDGHTMYGYLTIPNGRKPEKLPMVVNPHGGPIGPRDNWGFNWETQLLASRGYLVLQLNYRGSGGYGQAFSDLGHGQWGGAMQDDLTDVTKWAIDKGYADPSRICMYGGSYGGYASLMAAVKEPDLYACVAGYVGVYDMIMMDKKGDIRRSDQGTRFLERTLGDDQNARKEFSPAHQAAKIKAPVFLAAGMKDQRAPYQHTEAMRDALVAVGHAPDVVILQDGEGHGFYKEENNLNFYTKLLAFFDRYIGDRRGHVEVETVERAGAEAPPAQPEPGDTGGRD
jgi:dipeptidyl aminopeptidase/acylaminoacyl peptidase